MKIVFIAGAYIGDGSYEVIEENILEAEKYQIALANLGIGFFCAHNHTRHFEEKAKAPESFYKELDMQFLVKMAGVVIAIPSWINSSGAKDEIEKAKTLGIPIFYPKSVDDLDAVIKWVRGE